ncbi:Hsp20/alpha crystallin family protein [Halobellus limi]|jgi:HSP20 family protein|uniref:Heat shock protein Hsp20 n=1 Tax=Halobellus limi TaxID=699433 RepID=A0A1H6BCA9_9EURY|nr:Hsp20 family protein [Halobellus limi]QCC49259.1 Hsp20/alpha crystallin family protein [Halobellus limi]SEG58214.1 heat shock protein Hsp20 [Halobellus limi]
MTDRKNPFRELDRLFEQMQENVEEASRWWESEPLVRSDDGSSPMRVDLRDAGDEFVLTAELPGFEKGDIDVRLTDRNLRVSAEREEEERSEDGEYIHRERHRASVSRSIPLREAVETDGVSATYDNGVLTVRMPKTEPSAESTEIDVS